MSNESPEKAALTCLDLNNLRDKRLQPGYDLNDSKSPPEYIFNPPAVTVNVSLTLDYNNERNSIKINFYYREQWTDKRLANSCQST